MNEERREEVIVLTDEEGNEYEFEVVQVLEVEGKQYAVLFPLAEGAEEDEAVIMRIEQGEDGEDIIVDIEDDAEWDKVVAEWEQFLEEEECDDEDCDHDHDHDDEDEGGCGCGGHPTKK